MSGVQRTPPNATVSRTVTPTPVRVHAHSEPDINLAVSRSENVNTNRSKRPRHALDKSPSNVVVTCSESEDTLKSWKDEHENSISVLIANQTAAMTKLTAEICEIKLQNAQIQASNAEIRSSNEEIMKSMYFINQQFEDFKREIADLKKVRQEQRQYIESLERKIQDLQQKSRSSGIEIRNVPQSDSETSEGLVKTVCNLGKTVGMQITDSELRDIYRLPGKLSSTPAASRPIIVEFASVLKKETLLSAVRSYNKDKSKDNKLNTEILGFPGKRQPVYVAEQLPSNTKKIFYLSRQFAKDNGFKFCWISNGNIFLRKIEGEKQILVHSEKCLEAINLQM
ncbi:hypothetical protein PYW08_014887 [Mythimna loreyi]|uniref:Uncharacterized protein n=1 Tax=Mythimna loreyi TaxID=667449 RepID=A0ACC2R4F2_9NEOP|nr:hypothetical protein PYW08_014887 [Mythimna loreyi]